MFSKVWVVALAALALAHAASVPEAKPASSEESAEGTDGVAAPSAALSPPPPPGGVRPLQEGERPPVYLVDLVSRPAPAGPAPAPTANDANALDRPGPLAKLFNPASASGLYDGPAPASDSSAQAGGEISRPKRTHCKKCGGGYGGGYGGGGYGGGYGGGGALIVPVVIKTGGGGGYPGGGYGGGYKKNFGGGGGGCGYGGCGGGGGGYPQAYYPQHGGGGGGGYCNTCGGYHGGGGSGSFSQSSAQSSSSSWGYGRK